jgi:hypothetical protein
MEVRDWGVTIKSSVVILAGFTLSVSISALSGINRPAFDKDLIRRHGSEEVSGDMTEGESSFLDRHRRSRVERTKGANKPGRRYSVGEVGPPRMSCHRTTGERLDEDR